MIDFSETNIEGQYSKGFVFTRLGKGIMQKVRSLRIDLSRFSLTSENRRILKKSEGVSCDIVLLPDSEYHWSIGKMASDFYSKKFGEGTMSANKIKELFTDPTQSNMNSVLVYRSCHPELVEGPPIGYCLAYQSKNIIHYAYPFYQLHVTNYTLHVTGLAMMTKAILHAKEAGKKYVYLGSVQESKAAYKLQFESLEWWDGKMWNQDISQLKEEIKKP